MKTAFVTVACIFALLSAGCSEPQPTPVSPQPVPEATPKPKPKTDWDVSGPKVNPMDNVTTQFVTTGYVVKRVLCFDNGRPCGHGNAPVYLKSPCWIDGNEAGSYHRKIRIKFDDGKPIVENWGILDDHKGLMPPSPQAFVAELKKHKTLMVEFGCDRSDPGEVMTLPIQGLQEALDSAQLKSR